jgi:hypothetical protein
MTISPGAPHDDRPSPHFPPIGPAVSRPVAPRAAEPAATAPELPPPFVATAHGAHTAAEIPTAPVWEAAEADVLPEPPELALLPEVEMEPEPFALLEEVPAPAIEEAPAAGALPDWLAWAEEGVASPAMPWADSLPAGSAEADESPEAIEALDAALDAALGAAPEPAELPVPDEVAAWEADPAAGAEVPAWLDIAEAGFTAPEPPAAEEPAAALEPKAVPEPVMETEMEAEAPVEAEPAPVVAESSAATAAPDATVLEVAERLERIAQALRTRPLHELLAAGGDPLDAMIAGIALGYAKQRGR